MPRRKLGLFSAISVGVGLIVATSCLVSLCTGVGLSGNAFVLALFIALLINSCLVFSFNELYTLMPNVYGGVGQYTLAGLGALASIVSNVSAYFLTVIFTSCVEMYMCGLVIHSLFPSVPTYLSSVVLLVVLFALNLRGIDVFSRVQNILAVLLIGSMLVLGVIGAFKLGTGIAVPRTVPEVTGFFEVAKLTAIAFWLFVGVEFIIPVARDMKNPKKHVFLAMLLSLVVLFAVQAVMIRALVNYVPLGGLLSADAPHMLFAENLLGRAGMLWMGGIAVLAGLSTLNTILPSVGRILQGMADERLVPKSLCRTNKKNMPYVGMSLIVVIDIFMIVSGYVENSGIINLILAGSCFWLVAYILTHITVLVLRKRHKDIKRNRVFFGIPQIIGIAGSLFMIWNISGDDKSRIAIFSLFGVMCAVMLVYGVVWLKFVVKKPLFKPEGIESINGGRV
ncbi:amino acid APC family transporter [Clostridia bacterium]|nr:amino acid APC family transporter [Clostridia bacterium]